MNGDILRQHVTNADLQLMQYLTFNYLCCDIISYHWTSYDKYIQYVHNMKCLALPTIKLHKVTDFRRWSRDLGQVFSTIIIGVNYVVGQR